MSSTSTPVSLRERARHAWTKAEREGREQAEERLQRDGEYAAASLQRQLRARLDIEEVDLTGTGFLSPENDESYFGFVEVDGLTFGLNLDGQLALFTPCGCGRGPAWVENIWRLEDLAPAIERGFTTAAGQPAQCNACWGEARKQPQPPAPILSPEEWARLSAIWGGVPGDPRRVRLKSGAVHVGIGRWNEGGLLLFWTEAHPPRGWWEFPACQVQACEVLPYSRCETEQCYQLLDPTLPEPRYCPECRAARESEAGDA